MKSFLQLLRLHPTRAPHHLAPVDGVAAATDGTKTFPNLESK